MRANSFSSHHVYTLLANDAYSGSEGTLIFSNPTIALMSCETRKPSGECPRLLHRAEGVQAVSQNGYGDAWCLNAINVEMLRWTGESYIYLGPITGLEFPKDTSGRIGIDRQASVG